MKQGKFSFTLIEIIAVIVIISILSVIFVPKFEQNRPQQAIFRLKHDIEYLRSLALIDEKFSINDSEYFKKHYQIVFAKSAYTNQKYTYSIFCDTSGGNTGNPDISELLTNPDNPNKLLSGGYSGILKSNDPRATKELNIGESYGVVEVLFEGGCKYSTAKRISFDELSRPMKGNLASTVRAHQRMMDDVCKISFCADTKCSEKSTLLIYQQTGFTVIN